MVAISATELEVVVVIWVVITSLNKIGRVSTTTTKIRIADSKQTDIEDTGREADEK